MPREQKEITSVRYSFYLPCAVVKTETQKPAILKVVCCRRQMSRLPLSPEQVTLQAPSNRTPLLLCTQHGGHPPTVYRRWPPPFGVARCPHIHHIGASCQEKIRVFPKKVEPFLAQLFWDNPREHRQGMVAQQNTLNRLSPKWYRSTRWRSGLPHFADAPLR